MTAPDGPGLDVEPDQQVPPAPPAGRRFTIGQVLTLACADSDAQQAFCGYRDLLDVLGFMLNDVPLAEDIPAAVERCRPVILDQHPGLRTVGPPSIDAPDAAVLTWLAAQEAQYGTELSLTPIEE